MTQNNLKILYEDNHLLVINKAPCIPVQSDSSNDISLQDLCKSYIKKKYNKPNNVFLGIVHRLDRPVSGIIVFAKTSKAASRLSEQIRHRTVEKEYIAILEGKINQEKTLKNYLEKQGTTSIVTKNTEKGKLAELSYTRTKFEHNTSTVKIKLKTGRHHQIRVQFSHLGHPLLGDFRYGSKIKFPLRSIALHAMSIKFNHPTTKKVMSFNSEPPWA